MKTITFKTFKKNGRLYGTLIAPGLGTITKPLESAKGKAYKFGNVFPVRLWPIGNRTTLVVTPGVAAEILIKAGIPGTFTFEAEVYVQGKKAQIAGRL